MGLFGTSASDCIIEEIQDAVWQINLYVVQVQKALNDQTDLLQPIPALDELIDQWESTIMPLIKKTNHLYDQLSSSKQTRVRVSWLDGQACSYAMWTMNVAYTFRRLEHFLNQKIEQYERGTTF